MLRATARSAENGRAVAASTTDPLAHREAGGEDPLKLQAVLMSVNPSE